MAAVLAGLSVAAILPALASAVCEIRREAVAAAHELASYGIRRLPGDIAYVGLFASPPILVAHAGETRDVAYVTAGQQVVAVLTMAAFPLGLVLLPRLAALWIANRADACSRVREVGRVGAHAGLFVTPQLLLFADIAAHAWLGPAFAGVGPTMRVMMLAAGPYLLYLLLRSPIDAVAVRAYNTENTLVAIVVFGGSAGVATQSNVDSAVAVAAAFAIGLATLGVLSLRSASRLFGIALDDLQLGRGAIAAAIAGALGLLVRPAIAEGTPGLGTLAILGVAEMVLATVFVIVLHRLHVTWPARLFAGLRRGNGGSR
jgi:O-antigen/teichoic acid export membrane protein